MNENQEMKYFIKLMDLIQNSRMGKITVSTPTVEKLREAYELANLCGLNFKITNQFLNDTLERYGDRTGVSYSTEGVKTCEILKLYSSHIWKLDEVKSIVLGYEYQTLF